MIVMELHVTKIEPPGPSDHPDFPVVHFRGTSHSRGELWDPNAHSEIKGMHLSSQPVPSCLLTTYKAQAPLGQQKRARYDGPHFPFMKARRAGALKVFKLAGSAAREEFLGIGSTSKHSLFPLLPQLANTNSPSIRDYDIRGPAGPTAFWKISDDIEDDPSRDMEWPE